jgi:hypothetical protein
MTDEIIIQQEIEIPDSPDEQVNGILMDIVENINIMSIEQQAELSISLITFAYRMMLVTHGRQYADVAIDILKEQN